MKQQSQQAQESHEVCSICMERRVNSSITPCEHKFCLRCIHRWSKKQSSCPFCRQQFTTINTRRKTIEVKPIRNIREVIQSRRTSLNTNINGNLLYTVPMVFYYPMAALSSYYFQQQLMRNSMQFPIFYNMNSNANFNFNIQPNQQINEEN